jgi:hypothetical protein
MNSGNYQAWMLDAVDLDGNPRVSHGVDMGAYEFQFPNHPPVAGSDTLGVVEGKSVAAPVAKLLANDTDPDPDSLTITDVSPTSVYGGTVALNGAVIVYTPAPDFVGTDSFRYTLSDRHGGTAEGVVVVTVTPADAPSLNQVSIKVEAHRRLLRFSGIPGQSYLVQWTGDLANPAWTDASPPIVAGPTGFVQFEDVTDPPPGQRFYRTRVAP